MTASAAASAGTPVPAASWFPKIDRASINNRLDSIRAANESVGPALLCLAAAFSAASNLSLAWTAVTLTVGVASGLLMKDNHSPFTETGLKITNSDIARVVSGLAIAYFIPCWAGVALTFTLFSACTLAGRFFAPAPATL